MVKESENKKWIIRKVQFEAISRGSGCTEIKLNALKMNFLTQLQAELSLQLQLHNEVLYYYRNHLQ